MVSELTWVKLENNIFQRIVELVFIEGNLQWITHNIKIDGRMKYMPRPFQFLNSMEMIVNHLKIILKTKVSLKFKASFALKNFKFPIRGFQSILTTISAQISHKWAVN